MQKIARRKLAEYAAAELQAGADAQELARKLAAYLSEQRRSHEAELLIRDIEAALARQHGVVSARVTTAHELDDATREAIRTFIKQAEGAASVVITDETTDTALVGGAVISTPDSTFDSSIRTRLRQLRATTKE